MSGFTRYRSCVAICVISGYTGVGVTSARRVGQRVELTRLLKRERSTCTRFHVLSVYPPRIVRTRTVRARCSVQIECTCFGFSRPLPNPLVVGGQLASFSPHRVRRVGRSDGSGTRCPDVIIMLLLLLLCSSLFMRVSTTLSHGSWHTRCRKNALHTLRLARMRVGVASCVDIK